MRKTRADILYWLPVVLWASTIFGASSDSGSFSRSSRIIAPLLNWLFPGMTPDQVYAVVLFVRKCAHLTEYAIFTILVWNAIRRPHRKDARPWSWRQAMEALWFAGLYAATDEFHQTFVPSREGCLRDVAIDTSGAAAGLIILWAFGRWRKFW